MEARTMKVASLVAGFLGNGQLHAARHVHTGALGYCNVTSAEGEGVSYVPNWAFDGRVQFGDVAVCLLCSAAMCALAEPA